jgi:tRNA(fMet)-specific endonuclease VapC
MLILDTDHLTEYQKGTSSGARRLKEKLDQANEPYGTTIVTVEEVMRGWMAAIRRIVDPVHQIRAYAKLRQLFRFFATWEVLDWTPASAEQFTVLKKNKTRIGTMDLKIASIALVHHATLLSRNRQDFQEVPDLHVADWLSTETQ